jgi:hypothetical protein
VARQRIARVFLESTPKLANGFLTFAFFTRDGTEIVVNSPGIRSRSVELEGTPERLFRFFGTAEFLQRQPAIVVNARVSGFVFHRALERSEGFVELPALVGRHPLGDIIVVLFQWPHATQHQGGAQREPRFHRAHLHDGTMTSDSIKKKRPMATNG